MFRIRGLAVCAVMLAAVALSLPAQASLYTFENLTAGGFLIGQDNWIHATGATSGPEALVLVGTGSDTSKVAAPFTGNVQIERPNDANFSIPTFTGTEKIAIEADFQLGTALNWYALGNGVPLTSMSPIIGFQNTGSGATFAMNFSFRKAFNGAVTNIPVASVAPEILTGDWVRIREEVDLAANGGDGSGSVFYKDLTLGQTSFTPVPGEQNLPAGLLSNTGGAYFWNAMFLRGGPSLLNNNWDNLSVEFLGPGVPEPATLGLIAIGMISLSGFRRKG